MNMNEYKMQISCHEYFKVNYGHCLNDLMTKKRFFFLIFSRVFWPLGSFLWRLSRLGVATFSATIPEITAATTSSVVLSFGVLCGPGVPGGKLVS